uniref:homing endonuclease n=1 Tax=Leptographium procerum TaxID=100367 RepID=UPI0023F1691D|nr:homing endonuclease [Leptographium procerum]WDW21012.1 homing endonuclease [Leptographium procerum]WDZ67194.1 homing endonuclease [Leptographium procerum]
MLINKSLIYNALLKYESDNFTLEILTYSEIEDKKALLEQYYLDRLKPEYTLIKVSYDRFKHSP